MWVSFIIEFVWIRGKKEKKNDEWLAIYQQLAVEEALQAMSWGNLEVAKLDRKKQYLYGKQ